MSKKYDKAIELPNFKLYGDELKKFDRFEKIIGKHGPNPPTGSKAAKELDDINRYFTSLVWHHLQEARRNQERK